MGLVSIIRTRSPTAGILLIMGLELGHAPKHLAIDRMHDRRSTATTTVLFILLLMTCPTHSRRLITLSAMLASPFRR